MCREVKSTTKADDSSYKIRRKGFQSSEGGLSCPKPKEIPMSCVYEVVRSKTCNYSCSNNLVTIKKKEIHINRRHFNFVLKN